MRKLLTTTLALLLLPLATTAGADDQKTFRWIDKEGVIHYGDKIPAEFAEMEKQILNEHGVTVDTLRGKRTAEEIAEEKRQELMAREVEIQRRQDKHQPMKYWGIFSGLQKCHREVQREKQREHGKDACNNMIELRPVGPQVLIRKPVFQGCHV